MPTAVKSILTVAAIVLLTALIVLSVRGGDGAGDPTALEAPTETATAPNGEPTAAGDDTDPVDGGDESPTPADTPSPTETATDPTDGGTDGTDAGEDGGTTDTAGEGSDGSGGDDGTASGGAEDDDSDVDDMPDTGVAGAIPLLGMLLTGLAVRLHR